MQHKSLQTSAAFLSDETRSDWKIEYALLLHYVIVNTIDFWGYVH